MRLELSHPYWHLKEVVASEPNITSLTGSYYFYRPQSLIDERSTISIPRGKFLDPEFMCMVIENCPSDKDFAFHSLVQCMDDIPRHVPLVDMSTGSRAHLSKLKAFLDVETFSGFVWFSSGRSFHGYGSKFVTHDAWIRYMGQMLLSNQKDLKATVDPRWIGHRLIAGYSALRWTKNTEHYLRLPSRLET